MDKKVERALHGPSVVEVVLGALLSFALGLILAAGWLVFKPVAVVRELPAEKVSGTVYFVSGSADSSRGRPWLRKRQVLVEGSAGELTLTEDELNAWAGASVKAQPAQETASVKTGGLNFRIRDNRVQIAFTPILNAFGFQEAVVVQARGDFKRDGEVFAFSPDELYIGSLPTHRVPGLAALVMRRLVSSQPLPEDIASAWKKISQLTVEGNVLRLKVQ